jgi:acyl-CoA hydrolase
MKLTVKEYATQLDVSIQSVYKKIKRGSLTTVKENNITYVMVDNLEGEKVVKPVQFNNCTELLDIIKRRDKEVKQLRKEIKRLTKKNEKQNKFLIGKYENALPKPKDDAVDVDVTLKKKKKLKKKRK